MPLTRDKKPVKSTHFSEEEGTAKGIMQRGTYEKSSSLFSSINESELARRLEELTLLYKQATSPNDLNDLITSIDESTDKIDSELNYYVALKQKKFQQEVTNIELNRATKLSSTITNSNELLNIFQSANDLGHSLTFKIKSLDEEIGNVNKTLEFVSNIQLLRNNINQASYAIEHQNWEVAAHCIHTITSRLSKELINGKFASVVIPSTDIPELPEVTINRWTEQLTEVFKVKFNEAAKAKNVPELTKYFQLFPLVNKEEVGLNCYSRFICQIISDTSKNLITSTANVSSNDLKAMIFADITVKLFESISMMLSQHGPLIKKYYSSTYPNALNFVITKIQNEIDTQVGIIGDTFYDTRRLDKYFQDIKIYSFPVLTQRLNELQEQMNENRLSEEFVNMSESNDIISIVHVGDLINELATIFHHWSLYCKFITSKYFKDDCTVGEELKLPDLILHSNFTKKIHNKYLPAFETLYIFYFRRSLEKAITIEEFTPLEPYLTESPHKKSVAPTEVPCSSVIDDVTLVLRNTLMNVMDTSIPSTVKKFISESFAVIQHDLINAFFIKNLNDNQPRYNQTLSLISNATSSGGLLSGSASPGITRSSTPEPSGMGFLKGASSAFGNVVAAGGASAIVGGLQTSSNSPKLLQFILYLNTVAQAQDYFKRVFDGILKNDRYLSNTFPFGKDKEKVELILKNEFIDPFITITNKIISDSVANLYNQSLKNKLVQLINDLFPESSDINYIIYSSNSLNDTSSLLKFTIAWQSLIRPFIQTLHKTLIFHRLMRLLVVNLAHLIEKKLLVVLKKFKINELGAIKLEKDLSYLINEVCEDNYQLREKFVRVTQLVLLVGMDDDEYDESIKHVNQSISKPLEDVSIEDDEAVGINWVLTPQERKQIRKARI
ncbi:COG4 transport protein-domain-containing protein [Scheffersomyces xylosifermentans]|uniref:COG4 transport protein-domain-containing protein n=1 Tax=Scheffersomyces xylosifermentans TaxID=1304137 RepID=UPI00315D29EF